MLEVWAVVLAVAARRPGRCHPAPSLAGGVPIGAVEADRGGVVVQFLDRDPIGPDGSQTERGRQAGPVGQEQLIERPSDPVVVDQLCLPGEQAEQRGVEAGRPGAQTVEGGAPERQVAHQHTDGDGRFQAAAPVGLG